MSENNRPHSRKRHDSGKAAEVHKRGEGLGGRPSGNASYNSGRPASSNKALVRGGMGGGAAVVALLLYMLFGGGGSGSQTPASTPVPTPKPTPVTTPASSNGLFNFGTQQSHNQTYVDASTQTVNTSVASGTRQKYTKLLGSGKDQMTIMIYMCGTDLESNYGMATNDINEMVYASMSDKVNIIIETGGTQRWRNSVMSNKTNQIYQVTSQNLIPLETNLGRKSMTDPNTLAEFITYCKKNYPANRNMLIFWDHGAGSITGYGHDQLFPNDSMSVDEIAAALKAADMKFDVIGFDTCLMANMENAIAIEPYADYMIASEETEPGTGWYYTNWLTLLAKNSSTPSLDFGKQIIDDFVAKSGRREKTTLSMIDLAEFKNTVPAAMKAFSKKITADVKGNNFQSVANARYSTREFAQSNRLDQIDLVHFCDRLGTAEGKKLATAIKSCVKYNKTGNVTNAYGLSIYFPYRSANKVNQLLKIYDNIDFDEDYGEAVRSFATMGASGQIVTNGSNNSLFNILQGGQPSSGNSMNSILDMFLGGGQQTAPSYGGMDLSTLLGGGQSYDQGTVDLFSSFFGRNHIETDDLVLTEKDGRQVLSLDEHSWSLVHDVKLNVWVDDGTGYIDLGLDNIFEFDDDNDLIMEYDGKWLAINDQVVSYYMLEDEYVDDNNFRTSGYIPAMLNGEEVHILVEWTDEDPDGVVLGAQKVYENGTEAKGLIEFQKGDQIDFICDYYDYDGNFQDRYYMNDEPLMVGKDGLEISDITILNDSILYGYQLTDIYNAARWTPMLQYKK